jgi:hypothetical protein
MVYQAQIRVGLAGQEVSALKMSRLPAFLFFVGKVPEISGEFLAK